MLSSNPCIDDLITTTRTVRSVKDCIPIITLIAEILLISTGRQNHRMFFPIAFLSEVIRANPARTDEIYKKFNVSGRGGYLVRVDDIWKN